MSSPTDNKKGCDKTRLDLVPLECLTDVADVFEMGAKKYEPWNWQLPRAEGGTTAQEAYLGAALRHLSEYQAGRELDDESGLPHVAHAIASLLILTHHIRQDRERELDEHFEQITMYPYGVKMPVSHEAARTLEALGIKAKDTNGKEEGDEEEGDGDILWRWVADGAILQLRIDGHQLEYSREEAKTIRECLEVALGSER